MHLPTSEMGSVNKLAPASISTTVPAASFALQSPSIFHPSCKKKIPQHSPFRLRFWCSSNAFLGLLSPSLLALFHSCPRDVLQFRSR
ncbi:hypothetical protein TNCV_3289481 [Trichonephila clavipes]|nr:hypothetical protein TNCV_3289481 [Trichonephila clavipes]